MVVRTEPCVESCRAAVVGGWAPFDVSLSMPSVRALRPATVGVPAAIRPTRIFLPHP